MKFKIGQEVECLIHGKGTVKEIRDERCHPITVYFKPGHADYYTKTGQHYSDGRIMLTPGTWEIKEVLPEPEFEKGQAVWVRDDENEEWKLRYYSHNKNEKHFVFYEQKKKGGIIDYNFIKAFEGTDPNN